MNISELLQSLIESIWQSNIELSLLLLAVLFARLAIRKTTKIYNAYPLWLSIPVGMIFAKVASLIEFTEPPSSVLNYAAQNYIVQPPTSVNDWTALGIVWVLITTALLLRLLKQHILLRKELLQITVDGPRPFSAKYPVIGVDKSDFSPAVYGFFTPKIYFPIQLQNELTDQQIKLIIRHEEHHITQRHLWLNLLWDIAVCLMWFNPLIYISRQGFRQDQELYCDYLVLEKSTQHDHLSYGHALLATVSATHSVSLLCSWKTFDRLEERIMNITQSTNLTTKLTTKIAITLSVLGIVVCTSIYGVSATEYDKEPILSQSRDDSGNTESIMRIDEDKSYIEENGKRYVIEEGAQRPISDKEDSEFTALMKKSKNNNKDSLTHSIDENGEKITWRMGETHFVEENGQRFVKERGNTRSMTKAEHKAFKEKVKLSTHERKQHRKALEETKSKQKHTKADVSLSAEIDRNTETIFRKNGKSYIEENGERYIVENDIERPMSNKENSKFIAMVKESKNKKKDSLMQDTNENGKKITWRTQNIQYIEDNGKRFVVEDGHLRPMTAAEYRMLEERIELAKREGKQYRKKKAKAKQKREQAKVKARFQTKTAMTGERFETHRLKAKATALAQYEEEFERARQKVVAKQKEVIEAQKSGQLSTERAKRMLESLYEAETMLSQQTKHVQQKIIPRKNIIENKIKELEHQQGIRELQRAI